MKSGECYFVRQPLCKLNYLIKVIICQLVGLIFQTSIGMAMEDTAY